MRQWTAKRHGIFSAAQWENNVSFRGVLPGAHANACRIYLEEAVHLAAFPCFSVTFSLAAIPSIVAGLVL